MGDQCGMGRLVKVPDNILKAPITPKLADIDAERVRRAHEAAIKELQEQVRKLIEAA